MTHRTSFEGGILAACLCLGLATPLGVPADGEHAAPAAPMTPAGRTNGIFIQSQPGSNAWNAGQAAGDWWAEIKRQHGHVGPWNVLGWRMAQAAMRELKSEWGRHDLEMICYVPPQTPFTCMVDGLSVGSGNTLGRLDLRLAEVMDYRQSFVAVRRKDGKGDILELRPAAAYLKGIMNQPVDKLETLSRQCSQKLEGELFTTRRYSP